ncbi:MAG: phage virion morphogenesis protein [Bacteroidales bacterium]|nr:phage virion morphogenesis protein [Bacteroidales bacterium]
MTIEEFNKYFANLTIRLQRELASDIPKKVGNKAVQLFKDNFQKEGFFGKAWKEVKRRLHPSGKNRAADTRAILTGPTGNLGRSIQYVVRDGSVVVESDLPYSAAHNEGTTNAGRSHNVHIPQRQFIGDSPELQQAIEDIITKEMNKALKQ